MRIGKVLHNFRISQKIPAAEVARKTGFNKGYIYRLEHDLISPTIESLEKYSEAIDMPLWKIIKEAETSEMLNSAGEKKSPDYDDNYTPWGFVADNNSQY